jgi:endoribonuclease Dicer
LVVQYDGPSLSYPTYPGITIYDRLETLTLPDDWKIPWDKIQARYEVTKMTLGLYGAEYYLYTELRYRMIQLFTSADEATKLNMDVMLIAYATPDFDSMLTPEFVPPSIEVLLLDELLSKYTPLFADYADPTVSTIDVHLDWCTPQIRELVRILEDRYTPSFQGIIFVEQRHVALALAKLLPRLTQLKKKIKCAELVGHGASAVTKLKIKGMAIQNQQDVVKQFRDGEINLRMCVDLGRLPTLTCPNGPIQS